jgi:hypothetical protein
MVHAFYDDGRSFAAKGFLCLCGYVSDDAGWTSFSQEWKSLLGRRAIARLHTSEFLSAGGEYQSLKETTTYDERIAIVQEFISIIQKHIIFGAAVAVDGIVFREIFSSYKKKGLCTSVRRIQI